VTTSPRKHKRKTPSQAFTRSKKICIGRSLKICGMVHWLNEHKDVNSFTKDIKQCTELTVYKLEIKIPCQKPSCYIAPLSCISDTSGAMTAINDIKECTEVTAH